MADHHFTSLLMMSSVIEILTFVLTYLFGTMRTSAELFWAVSSVSTHWNNDPRVDRISAL